MGSFWTKKGEYGLLFDENGAPYWCDDCPCGSGCLSDIKERQQAAGITTAWDSSDPTNVAKLIDDSGDTSYTLLQLKAYVNHIAPSFVSGTYSGGASLPTMLTNTYANSATSVSELCTLVLAMAHTREVWTYSWSPSNIDSPVYKYGQADNEATSGDAQTAAAADYGEKATAGWNNHSRTWWAESAGTYDAWVVLWRTKLKVTGLPTALSKTAHLYVKPEADNGGSNNVFHTQGQSGLVESEYCLVDSTDVGTAADFTSGYPLSDTEPTTWGADNEDYGVWLSAYVFLFEWDFTN